MRILTRKITRTPRLCPRASYRPRIEALEERRLLSTLVALLTDNSLLTFDSSLAGSTRTRITGIQPGEFLESIAIQPSTGQLYAMSVRHLYTVDLSTGAAQPVGNPNTSLGLDGNRVVMSFDPGTGNLRVVTDGLQNLTLSPATAQILDNGSAPHYTTGDLHFGKSPNLTFLAYTNQIPGADSTTLYAGDDFGGDPDNLVTLGGANGIPSPGKGEMFSVGRTEHYRAFTIGGPDNTAFGLVEGAEIDLWSVNLADGRGTFVRPVVQSAAGVNAMAMLPTSQGSLPTLSINNAAVNESQAGPANAVFTVTLSAPASQPVSVHYATADDTAQTSEDYPAVNATLTFGPGETIKTIEVPVNADQPSTADETFFVNLSTPTNASLARAQGVGTIRADGRTPVLGGIYIENFSDDQNPAQAGFDSTGTFQHCFVKAGQSHCVNDPSETNRPDLGYSVGTQIPGVSGVVLDNPALALNGATDRILFPNLASGVHVDFASVDVSHIRNAASVTFVGANGSFSETLNQGDPTQTVSVGIRHVLPSGQVLGRITEIDLTGTEAAFDNVKILVVPDQPPIAQDAFADTLPNMLVVVNILDSAHSQDGSPVHLLTFTQPGVVGARAVDSGDSITYFPAPGYSGQDQFTYTVTDPLGNTASATVHILVRVPPHVVDGRYTIAVTSPSLQITDPAQGLNKFFRATNDSGPKPAFLVNTPPSYGTLDLHPDGTFIYTPTKVILPGLRKPIFVSDSFTFLANDGLDSNVGTVTIQQILPALARSDSFTVSSMHSFSLVDFDSHGTPRVRYHTHPTDPMTFIPPEGALKNDVVLGGAVAALYAKTLTVDSTPKHGSLWSDHGYLGGPTGDDIFVDDGGHTLNPDGSFYYTPVDGFSGSDQFTYHFTYQFAVNGQSYSFDSNRAEVLIDIPQADPPLRPDNVVSLVSRVNGVPGPLVTLQSGNVDGNHTKLFQAEARDNPSPSDAPSADFPFGFFYFQVTGLAPGEATTVELTLSSPLPGTPSTWTYWRFGQTPANHDFHWYQFLYRRPTDSDDAGATGAEFIDSTHILLHFVDGGRGDDDLAKDGIITDTGGPAVPLRPNARFVAALYQTLLSRQPEAAGLNFWTGLLDKGASRLQVVQGIYNSPEHRGIQVDHSYATYFHRAADSIGRLVWTNALRAGVSETDVAVAFLTSPEYRASHAGVSSYVEGLFHDVLDRNADPSGRSAWQGILQLGAAAGDSAGDRAMVGRSFLTSPEKTANDVKQDYLHDLNRPARLSELDALLPLLQTQPMLPAIASQAILVSDEFFAKAATS
jgi:hypothetical protein